METELKEFLETQFTRIDHQFEKVATKEDLKAFAPKDDLNELKSDVNGIKADISELKTDVAGLKSEVSDIRANMATKQELQEVKEIVQRLDTRTDEDIRAIIKNLEELKATTGIS